jgi:hypothetical protein
MIAAEESFQAKAAKYAFSIMQANLATQVHSLAYSVLYGKTKLKIAEDHSSEVKQALTRIQTLRDLNKISSRSVKAVEGYKESLDVTILEYTKSVNADRSALAESLGLMNPQGVEDIIADEEFPNIVDANPIHAHDLFSVSWGIALERRQLFYLKKALTARALEVNFNWLDPTGNPHTALGFNLFPQGLSARSKMKVLNLEEGKFEQKLRSLADGISNQSRAAKIGYQEALEAYQKFREQVQEVWSFFEGNQNDMDQATQNEVAVLQLLKAYKGSIKQAIKIEDYKERWDLSHVRTQRLLFHDLYKRLLSDSDETMPTHTKLR